MSRLKNDEEYTKTRAFHFFRWMKGTKDPYLDEVEMQPGVPYKDSLTLEEIIAEEHQALEKVYNTRANKWVCLFKRIYSICSVLFCLVLAAIMLYMVSNLPRLGTVERPVNNEVSQVYIENGIQDTGAVNIVTGMILNYRAFDTFGETCVLFIATTCVMVLLMKEEEKIRADQSLNDRRYEPKNDVILQKVAFVLVPIVFIFGIYVILNGHLSPGGGFSGGAMIGAGMILYVSAYGFDKMQKFFNENTYKVVKVAALCTYCVVITYYLFMGANDFNNHISLGVPGMIFSSGIILWLNIFVGIEVACTMYAFYALFRRGGL